MHDWKVTIARGLVLALIVGGCAGAAGPARQTPPPLATTAAPSPSPTASPPDIVFGPPAGATQAPRRLEVGFSASAPLEDVALAMDPAPPVPCAARLLSATTGEIGCEGLLAGGTDYTATLTVTSAAGQSTATYHLRTMGDRLEGVTWYTEFEDPTGDPLACAAASIRIVRAFATGEDEMTAEEILRVGQQFNRSGDPGLDPVAIATMLTDLDPAGAYHYYILPDREEATLAIAYWLVRSGKPVIAITLNGQHAPVVIGFTGHVGASYDDSANVVTGLVVLDPQRGDLDPRTQHRRPDKYRTVEFQTGRLLELPEWYGDDWWFLYAYAPAINFVGQWVDIERSDGVYPRPHWGGRFVVIVDDGDAEHPPDLEGRVPFR